VTEIPRALLTKISPLTLHLDIMHVNGMPMLTTVDSRIKHGALVPLKNRTAESLYESLDNVLRQHNRATICVTSVDSDIEFKTLHQTSAKVHIGQCPLCQSPFATSSTVQHEFMSPWSGVCI